MRGNGKVFIGILLIVIGVGVLFGLFGIHLGGIIGAAIGSWLLYVGYDIRKKKGTFTFLSIVCLTIGGVILLSSIGGLISLFIGAALVYGGYVLANKERSNSSIEDELDLEYDSSTSTYDIIDEQFSKMMNEQSK